MVKNIDHLVDEDGYEALTFTGTSHRLEAMPTEGTTWCALIAISSPSDAAQLTPDQAEALAEFLIRQAARTRSLRGD